MKFLRVFGIILMVFNGITVFVLAVSASNLVKGMEGTLAENIVTTILMIAIFCGAFYGSYWIYLAGNPEKRAKRRQSKAAARYDRQIKKTEKKYAKQAARTEDASQAENASEQSDNNNVTINESSGETSGEAAPKGKEFFTVIAPYLELPYHDGDNFFLFETSGDAERFVRDSGRNDLRLRKLSDIKERTEYEANLGAELAEYFCCGYKGAKICGSDGSETVRTIDELLDEYNGRGNYGSIVPDAVRKVHNYLKQMDYSFRKYGPDMNSYPDFWKKHLNDYKHYAAESIARSDLCLPTESGADQKIKISILTAVLPDGRKWASVFTDQFAVSRYMRKTVSTMVFPGLIKDIRNDILAGKMPGIEGIMVNPGREEFRLTIADLKEMEL